jgi:hypothetical protein
VGRAYSDNATRRRKARSLSTATRPAPSNDRQQDTEEINSEESKGQESNCEEGNSKTSSSEGGGKDHTKNVGKNEKVRKSEKPNEALKLGDRGRSARAGKPARYFIKSSTKRASVRSLNEHGTARFPGDTQIAVALETINLSSESRRLP